MVSVHLLYQCVHVSRALFSQMLDYHKRLIRFVNVGLPETSRSIGNPWASSAHYSRKLYVLPESFHDTCTSNSFICSRSAFCFTNFDILHAHIGTILLSSLYPPTLIALRELIYESSHGFNATSHQDQFQNGAFVGAHINADLLSSISSIARIDHHTF